MTEDASNEDTLRNCLADILIAELAPAPNRVQKQRRKRATAKWQRKQRRESSSSLSIEPSNENTNENYDQEGGNASDLPNDADDLSDFIEYLSADIFEALPPDLQTLNYTAVRNNEDLAAKYSAPLPLSTLETLADHFPTLTADSLQAYGLLPPNDPLAIQTFLRHLLTAYVSIVTSPPASLPSADTSTRPTACEICGRDWIPLTYHHLIPRGVHAKVLKRGWHEDWRLNSVAWICRACHSMVHRVASNEELAREFWSVELLLEREDVRAFAAWVGGVRWKKK